MSTTNQWEGVMTHVDKDGKQQMFPRILTDPTLSVGGRAADAAAVGAKMKQIEKTSTSKPTFMTQEQYDNLPEDQKNIGTIVITDANDDPFDAANVLYTGSRENLGNTVESAIDTVDEKVGYMQSQIVDLVMMSSRLTALENKFSTYVPVDTQTGTFSKVVNNHSSASQTITFDPVFTNVPLVNAEYTNAIGSTHAGNISITVSDITRYSCVVTINNNSTANFTFDMVWTAIADA